MTCESEKYMNKSRNLVLDTGAIQSSYVERTKRTKLGVRFGFCVLNVRMSSHMARCLSIRKDVGGSMGVVF